MNIDSATAARLHNLYWSLATVGFIAIGSYLIGRLAASATGWRGGTPAARRRAFWGYTFAAPWLLGFAIFVVGPALASLYYSFTDYRLGRPLEWVGLENYRILIEGVGAHGRRFVQAMYNSFYYAIVGVPLQVATALAMAMLVSRPLPGIGLFRLVFYLPVILAGGPAILLAWRYMLASNGGFVNLSLRGVAEAVPGADWLYRGFIFSVEGFNSFYSGLSRGDPVGTLAYLPPTLLGAAVCAYLLTGGWDESRRGVALRLAEVITVVLVLAILTRGVVAEGADPALWLGLAAGATGAIVLLLRNRLTTPTLRALLALSALLGAGLLMRLVMLEGGDFAALAGLLTLRGTLSAAPNGPVDLAYLREAYPASLPASAWVWGGLAALLAAAATLPRTVRVRRAVLSVAGLGLLLLAVGSLLEGVRYFAAFARLGDATGSPVHHFALFRQTVAALPELNRVPLWLQNELWAKPSLVLITMWSSGAGMLIFLAALKGVPRSLYEAAEVDGAGPLQRFFRITLPMISPATFYNIVIGLIAALQTFEAVYIIQTGQTESSLASAAYFLYVRTFRQLEIGQGAAASWILAVIIVVLTVFQFRYSRWVHYEG